MLVRDHHTNVLVTPQALPLPGPAAPLWAAPAASTAYRNYRASLARGKLLFLRAISFW
jgi:hypothetical protein